MADRPKSLVVPQSMNGWHTAAQRRRQKIDAITSTCLATALAAVTAVGLVDSLPDPRGLLGLLAPESRAAEAELRTTLIADTAPRMAVAPAARPARHGRTSAAAPRARQRPFEGRLALATSADRPTDAVPATASMSSMTASPSLPELAAILPPAGVLTSRFSVSRRHPVLGIRRPHLGVDLRATYGTPILAPSAGVVRRVAREQGFGLMLEIDHGGGVVTKYAHCSRVLVKQGQQVSRGDRIAAVGRSGVASGPHLHYEVRVNDRVVDPLTFAFPDWAAIPDSIAFPDPMPH
jgi:murein DD-endopeptidase MepM/ murein hydrolase activator NlpD